MAGDEFHHRKAGLLLRTCSQHPTFDMTLVPSVCSACELMVCFVTLVGVLPTSAERDEIDDTGLHITREKATN